MAPPPPPSPEPDEDKKQMPPPPLPDKMVKSIKEQNEAHEKYKDRLSTVVCLQLWDGATWYPRCIICERWADKAHLQSSAHKKKLETYRKSKTPTPGAQVPLKMIASRGSSQATPEEDSELTNSDTGCGPAKRRHE